MASTDRAAHICPVGVILPKRRGFAVPIGQRRYDDQCQVGEGRAGSRTRTPRDAQLTPSPHGPRKLKVATVSLAGCFGCHMSFLDIDERLLRADREGRVRPLAAHRHQAVGRCDIGLIEGGLCNAENVHVLREFRAHCKTLVAVGACAINGGLPAQRNHLDLGRCCATSTADAPAAPGRAMPNDPELPLPLNQVHPIHEVVHVDYFLPGCPPIGDAFWQLSSPT
jgi:NAD-reducing hydrogenase small subunit